MVTVVREAWRPSPLAWIHRVEARSIAAELAASGRDARLGVYEGPALPAVSLLRLSDPVMWQAVQALARANVPYIGPGAAAMARCYDKYEAVRRVQAAGIETPRTALGNDDAAFSTPFIVKPRQGSDSIGMTLVHGALPSAARTAAHLVQEHVRGVELTVAMVRSHVGVPLRIVLPEGVPYTFARKYLRPPKRVPLTDGALTKALQEVAARIAVLLGVDWAARIDFIRESSGRLCFLECDAAPLIGPKSAFATSLAAAGVDRARQLGLLLNEDA